jgi:hypothetical protein
VDYLNDVFYIPSTQNKEIHDPNMAGETTSKQIGIKL